MKQVNVLGTIYTVKNDTEMNDPKLKECDDTVKLCVVADLISDTMSKSNLDDYKNKVTRHELIHAFLFESGLSEMSSDETFVDWIAAQFPKLMKVFQEADCM